MNSSFKQYWFLVAVATLLFASASFGQTVTMTLTGVNGANDGGVFTDPYYGTITSGAGTSSGAIICDDYADESLLGQTWKAVATNVASAGTTSNTLKWSGANGVSTQTLYNAIASLATTMLTKPSGPAQEAYSFAIWELTYLYGKSNGGTPSTIDPISTLGGDSVAAAALALLANPFATGGLLNASTYAPGAYSNVTIYTPTNVGPPQEFITVPEASTLAMLGVDLLGLLALAFFFRRRGLQLTS